MPAQFAAVARCAQLGVCDGGDGGGGDGGKMLPDAARALSRRSASELSEHVGIVAILRGSSAHFRRNGSSGVMKKAAAGSHKFLPRAGPTHSIVAAVEQEVGGERLVLLAREEGLERGVARESLLVVVVKVCS